MICPGPAETNEGLPCIRMPFHRVERRVVTRPVVQKDTLQVHVRSRSRAPVDELMCGLSDMSMDP